MADASLKTQKPVILGALDTFPRVRRAIARVTKALLAGDLPVDRGRAVIYGLGHVTATLREEVIEAGLRDLEVQAGLRARHMPSGVAHEQLVGFRKRKAARERLQ